MAERIVEAYTREYAAGKSENAYLGRAWNWPARTEESPWWTFDLVEPCLPSGPFNRNWLPGALML